MTDKTPNKEMCKFRYTHNSYNLFQFVGQSLTIINFGITNRRYAQTTVSFQRHEHQFPEHCGT